jgi:hypothetical protein
VSTITNTEAAAAEAQPAFGSRKIHMWRIQIFLPSTPFMGVRISWETVARNCTGSQGAEMCIVVSL